jgi:hypothetical protein
MKKCVGMDSLTQVFLTSVIVGDKWKASSPDHFSPGEKIPGAHWIGRVPVPVRAKLRSENSSTYLTYLETVTKFLILTRESMCHVFYHTGFYYNCC